MEAASKQISGPWMVCPHPFAPGRFCARRIRPDGKGDHLMSPMSVAAPQIETFWTREEACAAIIKATGSAS